MTRAEYHRLGDAGGFGEEKVELLFGVVVEKTPIDRAHIHSTNLVRRLLERALGDRAVVVEVVEVYRDPDAGTWRTKIVHGRGERVAMLRFPDVEIAVSDILPPRP